MPYFLPGITINNGSAWSASYATAACSVSGYANGATVLIGNYSNGASGLLQEVTIGNNVVLSGAGVLSVTSAVSGAISFASAVTMSSSVTIASTLAVTGAVTVASTLAVTGALTLATTLTIPNGGTSATTAAAANQSLTPATVVYALPGATQTVNWASGSAFYITLSANLTISFSNATDGQVITILILNTASNYTVTWPSMKWQGAVAPTMTTGAHYDLYTVIYNSTVANYLGAYVQNY